MYANVQKQSYPLSTSARHVVAVATVLFCQQMALRSSIPSLPMEGRFMAPQMVPSYLSAVQLQPHQES